MMKMIIANLIRTLGFLPQQQTTIVMVAKIHQKIMTTIMTVYKTILTVAPLEKYRGFLTHKTMPILMVVLMRMKT